MLTDAELIALFFARSEDAIRQTDAKYGRLCHSLAHGILHDSRDTEECVNDAYLGLWNAIPPARPESLPAFLCRIVRNTALHRFSHNHAAKRSSVYEVALEELADCLPSPETVESELETRELTGLLNAFLATLRREDCALFLRRYWFADSYAAIARRFGISEKNVSVRLTRIRQKLRRYLKDQEVI